MPSSKPTRRHFTDAARAAAKEARRRKQQVRATMGFDCPEIFVVRRPGGTLQYHWEIRRFGGVVLDRSDAAFARILDARFAGERVLSKRPEQIQ